MSQMLIIKAPELTKWDTTLFPKQNAFMTEIQQIPGVSGAAFSSLQLGDELSRSSDIQRGDQLGPNFSIAVNWTSPNFINLYQMKMLAGRELSIADCQSNGFIGKHNLILNQSAIRMLEFKSPDDAIGRQIFWGGGKYDIVGVVADFHQRSLHYPIEPTMFMSGASPNMPFSVKVDPHHINRTIAAIRQKYDVIFPGNLFDYFFLDQKFNQQYRSDQLFGRVFAIFSGLAIFIACLGLLGLSLLATIQKTKEIGIRKVLGASVGSIVVILSKDFIRLVLIAILIASPIAWFLMNNWLQNFASRVNINWWVFIGSGLLATIIAFITISFQSVKAALANPVKSLRSE